MYYAGAVITAIDVLIAISLTKARVTERPAD